MIEFVEKKIIAEHREYWNHLCKQIVVSKGVEEKNINVKLVLENYFYYVYSKESPISNMSFYDREQAVINMLGIDKMDAIDIIEDNKAIIASFDELCYSQEERIMRGIEKRIDNIMFVYNIEQVDIKKISEDLATVRNINELLKMKQEIEKKIVKDSSNKTRGNKKPSLVESGII